MITEKQTSEYFRIYDLLAARRASTRKEPAAHQQQALKCLHDWYRSAQATEAGGILVLPTGAGKTFTALRFLCTHPLSDGHKVLWLAHTHHLLDQALGSFDTEVALVAEPRTELRVRVVSGMPGHMPVQSIQKTDDVIIGTLQTVKGAFKEGHPLLMEFLESCGQQLMVVFDEAHHSPAPGYRHLLLGLRERFPRLRLLGLTATPTYHNEEKVGWLKKLFPQGILYQVSPALLMADNILSKPIPEEPHRTNIVPEFSDRDFQTWVGTNQDIPEHVISKLAENRERNAFIAESYLKSKEKYGKTIIFADRWYQCEFLREYFLSRGIRAEAVYSHVDSSLSSATQRNRRARDENARVIERFRKNDLDVLLNVKMLTEGTDVPDVKTVFITRQTTSRILMTQMIGRALRGPKFGGTSEAHLVFFMDNWKQAIQWVEYSDLVEGMAEDDIHPYFKRPPLQLISIELVRKLARQMDSGINVEVQPFQQLLPVGWYRVDYSAAILGTEEVERIQRLIMVFDNEVDGYSLCIEQMGKRDLRRFADEDIRLSDVSSELAAWRGEFFPNQSAHMATNLDEDLFGILRHTAQHGGSPQFFNFEERQKHDLDVLASEAYDKDWSTRKIDEALRAEYNRNDRYWATLYTPFALFVCQFQGCLNRITEMLRFGQPSPVQPVIYQRPQCVPDREPTEDIKRQVKERDQKQCICCTSTRKLQVDHVHSWHMGGSNLLDNLQTLCSQCNQLKGTRTLNFRDPQTDRAYAQTNLVLVPWPSESNAGERELWEQALRRCINFFYECAAVHAVTIGERGFSFYHWKVELRAGNDPQWMDPHLEMLLTSIRNTKEAAGFGIPKSITIEGPGFDRAFFSVETETALDKTAYDAHRNETRAPSKRQIVELLPRDELKYLVERFDLEVEDGRFNDQLIDAITRSRRVSIEEILNHQTFADLKTLCSQLMDDQAGCSRQELIARLVGTGKDPA